MTYFGNGGPAFPKAGYPGWRDGSTSNPPDYGYEGMALRDYFAAICLGAFVQSTNLQAVSIAERLDPGTVAKQCYALANAMLEERAKP